MAKAKSTDVEKETPEGASGEETKIVTPEGNDTPEGGASGEEAPKVTAPEDGEGTPKEKAPEGEASDETPEGGEGSGDPIVSGEETEQFVSLMRAADEPFEDAGADEYGFEEPLPEGEPARAPVVKDGDFKVAEGEEKAAYVARILALYADVLKNLRGINELYGLDGRNSSVFLDQNYKFRTVKADVEARIETRFVNQTVYGWK